MKIWCRFAMWVLTAWVCSVGAASAELLGIEHEGLMRKTWLHNAGDAPRPMIVFLHGYRNEARHQRVIDSNYTRLAWDELNAAAETEGFAVVYPSAWTGRWSIYPDLDEAWHPETGAPLDDIGYVLKVVDQMVADGVADAEQIYLVGYSDGSTLSFNLMCAPDHPFAGAITLTGSIPESVARTCDPKVVPYLAVAGTNDRILGYDGWTWPGDRTLSTPETMHIFVKAHGCQRQRWHELPDVVPEDQSVIRLVWWNDCDTQDGAVRLMRVEGAGHTLPSRELGDPDWVKRAGGQNQDLEIVDEIIKFFTGQADLPDVE